MTSPRARILAALAALVMVVSGATAAEDPVPWDQDKVTGYAETFTKQMADIYRSVVRKQTGASIGSGKSASFVRLKDDLRLARNEARALERQLQDGKTRQETFPVFERLMTLVRNARENARRMFLEQATLDDIAAARDTLRELAPFYKPGIEAELDRADKALGGGTADPD